MTTSKNSIETWDTSALGELLQVILALGSQAEAKDFFRDLLTDRELKEFSLRWKAVRMLSDGFPYTEIVSQTGLSSTTVARISRWLKNGRGGYRRMLRRVRKNEKRVVPREHKPNFHNSSENR